MALVKEVIGKHLECPICMETFKKSKVLHCQHTFCESCISNLFTNLVNKFYHVVCPTCRFVTKVLSISKLKPNFVAESIILDIDNALKVEKKEWRKIQLAKWNNTGDKHEGNNSKCKPTSLSGGATKNNVFTNQSDANSRKKFWLKAEATSATNTELPQTNLLSTTGNEGNTKDVLLKPSILSGTANAFCINNSQPKCNVATNLAPNLPDTLPTTFTPKSLGQKLRNRKKLTRTYKYVDSYKLNSEQYPPNTVPIPSQRNFLFDQSSNMMEQLKMSLPEFSIDSFTDSRIQIPIHSKTSEAIEDNATILFPSGNNNLFPNGNPFSVNQMKSETALETFMSCIEFKLLNENKPKDKPKPKELFKPIPSYSREDCLIKIFCVEEELKKARGYLKAFEFGYVSEEDEAIPCADFEFNQELIEQENDINKFNNETFSNLNKSIASNQALSPNTMNLGTKSVCGNSFSNTSDKPLQEAPLNQSLNIEKSVSNSPATENNSVTIDSTPEVRDLTIKSVINTESNLLIPQTTSKWCYGGARSKEPNRFIIPSQSTETPSSENLHVAFAGSSSTEVELNKGIARQISFS